MQPNNRGKKKIYHVTMFQSPGVFVIFFSWPNNGNVPSSDVMLCKRSNTTRQKNEKGSRKKEPNDSPEITDGGWGVRGTNYRCIDIRTKWNQRTELFARLLCFQTKLRVPFGYPLTKSYSTCFSLTVYRFQTKLRVLFGSPLTKSHSACFSLTDCRFQTKLRVPFGFPLNPSLPHPVQFTGWKMHARAFKQYIFLSYNTSTFNAMRFDENPLTHRC